MENNNRNWYETPAAANKTENSGHDNQHSGGAYSQIPNYQQGGAQYMQNPYGQNYAWQQPEEPPKKEKKRLEKKPVTMGKLVACMLVMALLGGGIGAGAMYLIGQRNADTAQPGDSITGKNGNAFVPPSFENAQQETAQGGASQNAADSEAPSAGLQLIPPSGSSVSGDSGSIIRAAMSSVVGIDIEQEVFTGNYGYGFGMEGGESTSETVGSGSGVIITMDGYIVTNSHVVSGGETIKVHLEDGTEYTAELIADDSYTDLAVIKIDAENLPAAVLGNSGEMLVCDEVYAIGNPLGVYAGSVSEGIISGLDRIVKIEGVEMTLMQTTAAVNPGNSGGGLFNSRGELIGIVNAKSSGSDVEGLGFAIPIDSAKGIIADMIDLGYVTGRPYLGISMQNISIRTASPGGMNGGFFPFGAFGSYGYVNRVQVANIEAGSAAEQGGMQVNDIIISINGTEVSGSSELSMLLYEYQVGESVTITVQRGTELLDLSIVLGERSN